MSHENTILCEYAIRSYMLVILMSLFIKILPVLVIGISVFIVSILYFLDQMFYDESVGILKVKESQFPL